MTAENLPIREKSLDLDRHAVIRAQLAALRDLALTVVQEVESIKHDSMLNLKDGISLHSVVRQYEIGLIIRALRLSNGSQLRASNLLGLKPSTLNAKIKRYNIGMFAQIGSIEEAASPRE